jgi:hypothetical protein
MIEHVPPKPFPPTSLVGIAVPQDFNKVIIAAAAKDGVCYEDQLLKWAQMGAECQRMHSKNEASRRKK